MSGETYNRFRWIRTVCVVVVSLFLALSATPLTVALAEEKPSEPGLPQEVQEVTTDVRKPEPADSPSALLDLGPTSNVWVDDRAGASTYPSVATDSSGNIYVVYEHAYSTSDHDIHCAKSTDGGLTWTNYVVDWDYTDSRQPALFIDANGKLWVAYTAGDFFRFATSTNGGVSWSVWGISSWTWYRRASYPSIGVWGNYVYIAFQYDVHGNGNEYDVAYVYSGDGGQSWYNRQDVVATNRDERYPSLGINGSRVGVAYEHESNQRDHSIRYAYNGGLGDNSWTDIAVAAAEARYPSLSASGDSWIVAFEVPSGGSYDVHTRASTDGGQSWSGADALALSGARYPAITNQGADAWVVGFSGADVAISHSTDGGANWDATASYLVDTDTAVADLRWADVTYWPTSGPSAGRHPAVAWADSRNSATNYDIYYATLNENPQAAVLNVPADGEETDLTPDFTFSATDPDADSLSYQIQIDNESDFSSPLVNKDSSTGAAGFSAGDPYASGSEVTYTYQDTDPALSKGATYYWRVRAEDFTGAWGDWSPVWSFDANSPTAVTLAAFTAEWKEDKVLVAWETAIEINTVGFNLWRSTSADGGYERVNEALIPAASLGGVMGEVYEYVDTNAAPGATYYYKLEEVEAGGARNWYGPVSTGAEAPTAVTISSFRVENQSSPALIWWLAAAAIVVGASGSLLNRLRKNRW